MSFLKSNFSLQYLPEWLAAAFSFILVVLAIYQFYPGKHYIIPTLTLSAACVLGNLAYYGFCHFRWAKLVLFWLVTLAAVNFLMALFWAQAPRDVLGFWFVPVYALVSSSLFGAAVASWRRQRKQVAEQRADSTRALK